MSIYIGGLLAYLIGMGVYLVAGIGISMTVSLSLLLFTAVGVLVKRLRAKRFIYAALFLLGVLLIGIKSEPSPNVFDKYIDRYIEIEGVISKMPDEYDSYYSYILNADKLTYLTSTTKINEKLRITSPLKLDMGNRVAFRGVTTIMPDPDNSTDFNYAIYYKSMGITHKMHALEASVIKDRDFVFSMPYIAEYVKSRIGMGIDKFYSDDDGAMLKAVLLGNRNTFSDDFQGVLKRTSAIRFLYPSYLHIFLLISLCQVLFSAVRKRYREGLTIAAMFVFVLLNSGFITFLRAGILFLLDWLFRRKRGFVHYPDVASAVILMLLIANPLLIYNSGFVISVTIGMLLHMFRYPLALRLKFIKNTRLRTMLAMCIIGTVGLVPLTAYYYNGTPLYSFIFTFVYTPLVLLLLITAPITLLLKELFNAVGIFGVLTDGIIEIMKNLPTMVSLLPGYYITLARTSLFGLSVWITLCYMLKLIVDERIKERAFKLSAVFLAILLTTGGISAFSEFGRLSITFPNLGQGDGAILEVKGKSTVLIDGGGGMGDEEYNIGENVFLPYLTAKGYNKIDLAIVSHLHRDHAEGIIAAIENLNVDTVMISDTKENTSYKDKLIKAAKENDTKILYVNAGDRIEFKSGLTIDVLYPQKDAMPSEENDYSLALLAEYDGVKAFFGGDMTEKAEKEILEMIDETDIVKVSHHGSKNSSGEKFIEKTSPKYAVICVGENNSYGHPADRVVVGYKNAGARILRTDLLKDIVIKSKGEGKIGAIWYGEVKGWQ